MLSHNKNTERIKVKDHKLCPPSRSRMKLSLKSCAGATMMIVKSYRDECYVWKYSILHHITELLFFTLWNSMHIMWPYQSRFFCFPFISATFDCINVHMFKVRFTERESDAWLVDLCACAWVGCMDVLHINPCRECKVELKNSHILGPTSYVFFSFNDGM